MHANLECTVFERIHAVGGADVKLY